VLDRDLESFDEAPAVDVKPRAGFDGEDPFAGFDDIRVEDSPLVPTLDDLLADMPPPAGPVAVIDFPPAPAAVPPSIEPPDVTPTLAPASTAPSNGHASGRSIIADAFSALLAVEQGEPGVVPPRLGGNGSAPIVTDTLIDDVARRVIQRLALGTSDQMQVVVKEIVSGVAERLVREEIDRIRRNAPRS
jgi:hypothetical protein